MNIRLCCIFGRIWRRWRITSCWIRTKHHQFRMLSIITGAFEWKFDRNDLSIVSNCRKVILLHDNARPHAVFGYITKPVGTRMEGSPTPDLASSDYYLLRSTQHDLGDTHFANYEEVKKWIAEWIELKDKQFYRRGIQLLPERWEKIIGSEGKYFH